MLLLNPFEGVTVALSLGDFPDRERQTAEARRLVEAVAGRNITVRHKESGAPYLEWSPLHISISHCPKAVCVALADHRPVGVDVQEWRDSLGRVSARFLPELEEAGSIHSKAFLLTAWTYKEACYKLLQNFPDAPVSIPLVPLFSPGVEAWTCHLGEVTLTLCVSRQQR